MQSQRRRVLLAMVVAILPRWTVAVPAIDETCPEPSIEVARFGYGTLLRASRSPDGLHVAVAGSAGVTIWNVEKGNPERLLLAPGEETVNSVAWSTDGSRIAAGASSLGVVLIWSADDGQLLHTLRGHTSYVYSVAWSPDGTRLLTGSADRSVRVWSVDDEQLVHLLTGHSSTVYAVDWSSDGAQLASGAWSPDGSVRIWSAEDGHLIRILQHENSVHSLRWSPDSTSLATMTGRSLYLWSGDDGRLLRWIAGDPSFDEPLAWSPDSTLVAAATRGAIRLWAAKNGELVRILNAETSLLFMALSWSPDGSEFLAGSFEDQVLRVWSTDDGRILREMLGHTSYVSALAWSPDGGQLVTGSNSGVTRVWSSDGRIVNAFQSKGEVASVAWSPDGTQFAVAASLYSTHQGCTPCTVGVWSKTDGRLLHTLAHEGIVNSVSWSPDGEQLATASGVMPQKFGCVDCALRFWSASDGRLVRRIEHADAVYSVAWSPDGMTVATGSSEGLVELWSADSGEHLNAFRHTPGFGVGSVVWSPDSTLLASANRDVRIWFVEDGQLLHTLAPGRRDDVLSLNWLFDGTRLASGSFHGSVEVWSPESGELVRRVVGPNRTSYPAVAWRPGPGECSLASGSDDGIVRLWGPDPSLPSEGSGR